MTEQTHVAPGWYSNGVEGQQQWWDGSGWSENTRQAALVQPLTADARLAAASRWRRDYSLIVAILLLILSFPVGFVAFFAALSFSVAGLPPVILWMFMVAGSIWLFVNYYLQSSRLAAARALQPPPSPSGPAA